MGGFQNNPSIGWLHPKSTHAHPLAGANKKLTCRPITLSIQPTFDSLTPIPAQKVFPQCLCRIEANKAKQNERTPRACPLLCCTAARRRTFCVEYHIRMPQNRIIQCGGIPEDWDPPKQVWRNPLATPGHHRGVCSIPDTPVNAQNWPKEWARGAWPRRGCMDSFRHLSSGHRIKGKSAISRYAENI
jgi:hypothetical protein